MTLPENDFRPMRDKDTRLFKSPLSILPFCELRTPGPPKDLEFRVTKVENGLGILRFVNFRAFQPFGSKEIDFGSLDCRPGFIDGLKIPGRQQQCGIGTFLARLCMNENKIHDVKRRNPNHIGVQALGPKHKNVKAWVKSHCSKFVLMEVVTLASFDALDFDLFFDSLQQNGYTLMVIKIFKDSENEAMYPDAGPCSTEDFAENFKVRNNEISKNFICQKIHHKKIHSFDITLITL